MIIVLIMSFILGMTIGSFLNVVVYRLPLKRTLNGRSHCPNCDHKLTPLELVPVFSYLFLGRKCRNCKQSISPRYMFIELLTAVLFTLYAYVLLNWGIVISANTLLIELVAGFLIISSLISIFFIDLETMEIPDRFHVIIILSGIARILVYKGSFPQAVLAGLIISVPLFIVAIVTQGLGLGDIKLLFTSGFIFGAYNALLGLIVGCLFAIIYGIISKIGKGKEFPFGPHLVIGMYVILLLTSSQII